MGRPPRADEAGKIYHALNRGNARNKIFFKDADYEAFERIIAEGQDKFEIDLIAYQLQQDPEAGQKSLPKQTKWSLTPLFH